MTLLSVCGYIVLAGWVFIVLYSLIVNIMNWVTKQREAPLIWPRHIFAVVLPVEDPEIEIGPTLERLQKEIRYPRGMYDFIIVPINCKDTAISNAKQKGAIVYGPGKRRWLNRDDAVQSTLERLASKRRYHAYVVLDVNVKVSSNYLAILSDKLSKGAKIIQSGYRVTGPATSWKTGVTAVIQAISPSLFTSWTSRFRGAVGLRHIGICLSRDLVEKYGVRNPSMADDMAYMTHLLMHDIAIIFAPKAIVFDQRTDSPSIRTPLQYMEMRWNLMRRYAFQLIKDGIQWGSTAQITGGINLLMPPLSLVFILALFILSFITLGFNLNGLDRNILLGWALVLLGPLALVISRLVQMQAPAMAYLTLPSLPFFYMWRATRLWMERPAPQVPEEIVEPQVTENQDNRSRRRGSSRRRRPRRSGNLRNRESTR